MSVGVPELVRVEARDAGLGRPTAQCLGRWVGFVQLVIRALVHDIDAKVIDAVSGELIRELALDPTKRYQPIPRPRTSH